MTFRLKVDRQSVQRYALVATLSYEAYATFLYSVFGNSSLLRMFAISIMVGLNFWGIIKWKNGLKVLLFIVLTFAVFLGPTYFFFPENRSFISSIAIDLIKGALLVYDIIAVGRDALEDGLHQSACLVLLCCLAEPFTLYVTGQHDGYMVYGMRLLTPAVLLIYFYSVNHKRKDLVFLLTTLALILMYGNRSAFLISLICIMVVWLMARRGKKRFQRIFVIACLAMIIFFMAGDILSILSTVLNRLGFDSRTLSLMNEGLESFTDNNGRSIIWENCFTAIAENPVKGYGIGGDRKLQLLGSRYAYLHGDGIYPHNIFLEIVLDFGLPLGLILITICLFGLIKVIKKQKDKNMKQLIVVIIIFVLLKLIISSSLWVDTAFYFMVGMCVRLSIKSNNTVQKEGMNEIWTNYGTFRK